MSEDGEHLAFLASPNTVVFDGRVLESGQRHISFPMTLSADGSTLAYLASESGGVRPLMVNGKEELRVPALIPPVSSADGKTFAILVSDEKRGIEWIASRTWRSPDHEGMTPPALSRDGRVIAYGLNKTGESAFVIVGEGKHSIPENPSGVFLNGDGSRWGYVARHRNGDKNLFRVVTDTHRSEEFEFNDPPTPVFDPSGRRVAFLGRLRERTWLVIDGQKFEVPNAVGEPQWGQDGRSIGLGVLAGNELRWWTIRLD